MDRSLDRPWTLIRMAFEAIQESRIRYRPEWLPRQEYVPWLFRDGRIDATNHDRQRMEMKMKDDRPLHDLEPSCSIRSV